MSIVGSELFFNHLRVVDLALDLGSAGEDHRHLSFGITDDDVALDHRTVGDRDLDDFLLGAAPVLAR